MRAADRVRQVVLFQQAGDRQGRRGAESAVFDVDRNGDLRDCPSVRTTGRSSGRARGGSRPYRSCRRRPSPSSRASGRGAADVDAPPHALDDRLEVLGVDLRIMALVETAVERIPPLDLLDDVRDVVVAAVGDDGREVGQLQRRAAQRILPDGERDDRQRVPRPAVLAVVAAAVGDVPVALVEEVGTQLAAETEALDILFPGSRTLPSTFPYLGLSRMSRNT